MRVPFYPARSIFLLASALFTAPLFVFAGTGGQSAAPPVAVVGFRALGADGQPVVDLTASQVTLRVGGRIREMKSLEFVRDRRETTAGPRLPEPFATNVAGPARGRDVVVIIDEESLMPGRETPFREAILQLAAALGPADRVRLLSTRQGGLDIDLPDRDAGARAALERFTGHSTVDETEERLNCRSRIAVQGMRAVLSGYAGRPSPTVVVFSGGFGAPSKGGGTRLGMSGPCPPLQTTEFQELRTDAAAVGARAYVINAVDATASRLSHDMLASGLQVLAGSLDAEVINMVGGRPLEMKRIATETSAYYLAAFQLEAGDRAGTAPPVEILVAREGVKVRAPASVVLPKTAGAAAGAKPASPKDMLRASTAYRDLPLRAAAFASRADGGKIRLVVLFEPATTLNTGNIRNARTAEAEPI